MRSINIAIFASGSGSNAEEIIKYFENIEDITVTLILTNNPKAFVIERAKKFNVPYLVFNRDEFYNSDKINKVLINSKIDFIVLAGFLWLIPSHLVKSYSNRIMNIHPALLPKHGGKGMYGARVHEAVKEAGDKETGITIHYVNENYDEGDIIHQASCPVLPDDTPEMIQKKVHQLEYQHFAVIIEKTIRKAFKK